VYIPMHFHSLQFRVANISGLGLGRECVESNAGALVVCALSLCYE
jgi:hypothetical protein